MDVAKKECGKAFGILRRQVYCEQVDFVVFIVRDPVSDNRE